MAVKLLSCLSAAAAAYHTTILTIHTTILTMVAIMEIPYSPYLLCHSATVLPLEATLLLFYS